MPWGYIGAAAASWALNQASAHHNTNMAAGINERMFRNRYQWSVEDMKKAGLNPMLATGGLGSSPTGVTVPSSGGADFVAALSTAKQNKLTDQATETEKNRTGLVAAQRLEANASAYLKYAETAKIDLENQITRMRLPFEKQKAIFDEAMAIFDNEWIDLTKAQRFAGTAKEIMDVVPIGTFMNKLIKWLDGGKKGPRPTLLSPS